MTPDYQLSNYTPTTVNFELKTNREPENDGFQDWFISSEPGGPHFQVNQPLVFGGVKKRIQQQKSTTFVGGWFYESNFNNKFWGISRKW